MRPLGVDAWRADKRAKREGGAGACGEFRQEGEEDEVDNEGHAKSRRGLIIEEEGARKGLLERGVEQIEIPPSCTKANVKEALPKVDSSLKSDFQILFKTKSFKRTESHLSAVGIDFGRKSVPVPGNLSIPIALAFRIGVLCSIGQATWSSLRASPGDADAERQPARSTDLARQVNLPLLG